MLDIKFIRENPDLVKEAMRNRNSNLDDQIDKVLKIDETRRELTGKVEAMKAQQNAVSKKIPEMKKNGEDTTEIMKSMKTLSDEITNLNAELSKLEDDQKNILLSIPNVPHKSVPIGVDDTQNVEIRRWGEPTKFNFAPKAHWDLGKDLNILD